MARMSVRTFSYSAFLRGPSQVLPSLDDADVILERRDEENLVLMREERFEATIAGLRIAARSLAILARRQVELAEELLADEFPWLHWLPEAERVKCVQELLADLVAGADTGLLLPFSRNLASWRSTAEIWSDPELAERLQGPFPGDGPELNRPAEGRP
jgi:PHD/YefM family antitoxin component YafN of YafNO toxin-antitoxin module